MTIFLAALQLCTTVYLVRQMLRKSGGIEDFYLGVMAVFSCAYLVIPIVFPVESGLYVHSTDDLVVVQLLNFVFVGSLIVGAKFGFGSLKRLRSAPSTRFDVAVRERPYVLFLVAAVIYFAQYFSVDLTSYSSGDFEGFFAEANSGRALIIFAGTFCQALMAYIVASEYGKASRGKFLVLALIFGLSVFVLLALGQRLAVLVPCVMLIVAFKLFGHHGATKKLFLFSVLGLALLSPFAVYLRESTDAERGKDKVLAVGGDFSYGDNLFVTAIGSIAARADLLANSIVLKRYIDNDRAPGFLYYYSALVSPFPKAVVPAKPYPLSTDGSSQTEITVLAWRLIMGTTTGSLTAFGGITAYREGGWLWLPINGLLVGFLGAWLCRRWARGGALASIAFLPAFAGLVVKRAPSSLFEAVLEIGPLLLVVSLISILARINFSRRSMVI